MNPNGKWSFLVPVTLAAASLMATSPASATNSHRDTAVATDVLGRGSVADELVLQPGAGQPELKAHSSHSSHASHRSHYSSR
jgi:hypothetical protein